MRVSYKYSDKIYEGLMMYRKDEYSFDFISKKTGDITIVINYLQLTIDSLTNQLVSIWGYHPYQSWINTTLDIPKYKKGIVEIENNYESGISYREENMKGWKTFYDQENGWVWIGEKNASGVSIMFATNTCVVIEGNSIKALLLKPKFV